VISGSKKKSQTLEDIGRHRGKAAIELKCGTEGRFAVADSRPSWASMIERQIENPIPMPLDLV
jgi:hypothetical protein